MFKKKENKKTQEAEELKEQNEEIKEENEQTPETSNETPNEEELKNEYHENDVDLNVEIKYEEENLENIENARKEFYKIFKIENILKWVMGLFVMAVMIVAFIVIMPASSLWAFIACGIALAILIAYYIIVKQINTKKLNAYFESYYKSCENFVFDDKEIYSNLSGGVLDRIDVETFNKCDLYKDVVQVGSREHLKFTYQNKLNCSIVDCAAQIKTVKRLQPVFVGKLLTAPNTYEGENIIVYIKGNERSLPPTNVEGLRKVLNTKKMVIYSNEEKQPAIINNHFKAAINKIITNNILVDVAISIQKGATYVALGYEDNLMVLPLQDKFNPIPLTQYKKDLVNVLDLISLLNK